LLKSFPVVLEREDDGRYSVSAPDLPGCVSWGETREAAVDHIREAIELWIESAKVDGEDIPAPGSAVEYVRVAS
jgi:predicted RNase H-like HicB family nuclease